MNDLKRQAQRVGIMSTICGSTVVLEFIVENILNFSLLGANKFSFSLYLFVGITILTLGIISLIKKTVISKIAITVLAIVCIVICLFSVFVNIFFLFSLSNHSSYINRSLYFRYIIVTIIGLILVIINIVLNYLLLFRIRKYKLLNRAYQNSFSNSFTYLNTGHQVQQPQTFSYIDNSTVQSPQNSFSYLQPSTPDVKRICAGCGRANDENASFCEFCGKQFVN